MLELLARGESAAWIVAEDKVHRITHIQVVNFEGTQMIEGVFDPNASFRREDGRLVVKFHDGHIVNCHVQFDARNPVQYID